MWMLLFRNPKFIIGIVVLAGLAWASVAYTDHVYDNAYSAGKHEERDIWTKKIEAEKIAYQYEVNRLNILKFETENTLRAELVRLGVQHEKELADIQQQADTAIANVRNDNVKLRVKLSRSDQQTQDGSVGTTASTPSGDDSTTTGVLHPDVAEFLIRQAQLADEVSARLIGCQAVIVEYQETVTAYNAKYVYGQ